MNYWREDIRAIGVIDDLVEEGLSKSLPLEDSYKFEGRIDIFGHNIYFFAELYRAKENKPISSKVGFSLRDNSLINDSRYLEIKKELKRLGMDKEREISHELEDLCGENLNVEIPIKIDESVYPLVSFYGENPVDLFRKAKDVAKRLISERIDLADSPVDYNQQ